MAEGKATVPYMGISVNEAEFIGKVISEPEYFQVGEGQGAFIKLLTRFRKLDTNGQWVDTEQVIPLVCMDTTKVENTIKKYVPVGRQLRVTTYYSTWGKDNENHGFFITSITLGDKPYTPKETTSKDTGPALPM